MVAGHGIAVLIGLKRVDGSTRKPQAQVERAPLEAKALSRRVVTLILHVYPIHSPVPCTQVEKAPTESYADVGGLEQQIQEIKEAVELPLTHPELYEDIGIKPPKVCCYYGRI